MGVAHVKTRQTMKHNMREQFRKQSLHFQEGLEPTGRSGKFVQDDVQETEREETTWRGKTWGGEKSAVL